VALKFSIDLIGSFPLTEYVRIAKLVEDYGFDEVHVVDDLTFKPAWPILALIAANTSRIKVGPWLIAPRIVHPAYHAGNLAELDELSKGRAVCAIGRGGFFEFLDLGPPEKPLKMLREAVHTIRRLFAGDVTPFNGQFFSATPELVFKFEPVRVEIPLLIGTFGPQTCALAGEIADGFVTSCLMDPSYFALLCENFDRGARKTGRDPATLEKAASPICSVSRDREAAQAMLRPLLPMMLQHLRPMTRHAGLSDDDVLAAASAFNSGDAVRADAFVSDATFDFFTAAGTPTDLIPRLQALIEAGANHIAFGGPLGPDVDEAIKLIATEIIPQLKN